MNRRLKLTLSAVLAFTLGLAGVAIAHTAAWDDGVVDSAKEIHGHKHAQHGEESGHLPATSQNMDLVSKLKLRNVVPEKIADVGVYKGFAYLAAWGVQTCKYNGVHVVNIKDVENPREVAFIGAKHGSYPGEGIQALTIDTPAYQGDILVSNNEKCNATSGFGGMNIYDVSRPASPTPLYEGFGDDLVAGTGKKDAHETHSVFAWNAGDKAFAVMVDNEEEQDVDIVNISDPRKPKLIAEYDMVADFPEASVDQAGMPENFHHDVIVKKIGDKYVMSISYWDSGYILLDVTNPKAAKYIDDSNYAAIDPEAAESGLSVKPEGNGHQSEFTKDNEFLIATDEDFDPYKLQALDDEGEPFDGTIGIGFPPGSSLPRDVVYVGQACTSASVPAASATVGQIALVERGNCDFTVKQASIEAQNYDAMIVFNSEGGDPPCTDLINMLIEGTVPSFFVGRQTGFDLMDQTYNDGVCRDPAASQAIAAAPGTVFTNAVTISSYFDGWGYVHLYDADTMTDLDTYAVPQAHQTQYAAGFGDLSVHEVATSLVEEDLAYYSYYAAGVRATRIVEGTDGPELQEVGHFIDEGGSNFWGIEAFRSGGEEYIAASDRDHGLYILKYTGD